MRFPVDLPGCTSCAQGLDVVERSARPEGSVSFRLAWSSVVQHAKLRALPSRYLHYGVLPVSIAGVLLAGTVLPPAHSTSAVQPLAASYAVSGVMGAFVSDFPVSDEAALDDVALDDVALDDADGIQGALSFGAPAAAPPATPIVGTTTGDNVNLHRGPSTKQEVIARLPTGTKLEVIGQRRGWYRVATAKGTVGWVSDDVFTVGTEALSGTARVASSAVTGSIRGGRVNVRKGPSTRYASYGKLAAGTQVNVLGRSGTWYQVRSPRGTIGWVAGAFLTISENAARVVPGTRDVPAVPAVAAAKPAAAAAPTKSSARTAASFSDAARLAQRYVGSRYAWGGSSPRGFDCSGLVQYVYRQLGVRLPRKASAQYAQTKGQRIRSLSSLVPGDLVFFVRTTRARGITHVGLYVGNGMMVTANSPRLGVQKVNVNGKYWRTRFAGGVRPTR